MPELRKDPLTDRWVLMAPERAVRLRAQVPPRPTETASFCPFCPGHEAAAGHAVFSLPPIERNSPGSWSVRVVPNRVPALRVEGTLTRRGDGVYDAMTAIGAHEVIIESPRHGARLSDLSVPALTAVLQAYRARMLDLARDFRLRHFLVLRNSTGLSGAPMTHPHSQLVAFPLVPWAVQLELEGARRYYDFKSRCALCDVVQQELRERERLIYESQHVIAVAPYASRSPFEVLLLPRAHLAHYAHSSDELLTAMARALRDVWLRLGIELHDAPVQLALHTAPNDQHEVPHYHWHIELVPELSNLSAGFDFGSGYTINTVPPEAAAMALRRVDPGRPAGP